MNKFADLRKGFSKNFWINIFRPLDALFWTLNARNIISMLFFEFVQKVEIYMRNFIFVILQGMSLKFCIRLLLLFLSLLFLSLFFLLSQRIKLLLLLEYTLNWVFVFLILVIIVLLFIFSSTVCHPLVEIILDFIDVRHCIEVHFSKHHWPHVNNTSLISIFFISLDFVKIFVEDYGLTQKIWDQVEDICTDVIELSDPIYSFENCALGIVPALFIITWDVAKCEEHLIYFCFIYDVTIIL